ncbi:hypothetical protein GGX14DRAFT_450834 [Mycena pura]|uniref:Uncharacterized protein n=1 Tax=Mycena pura TaxID=153505 RepID=A0AAD6VIB5_9AGAR|nr:hypothetical protein GGX14DRAFT_450834 [Mycena pura]
MDRTTTPTRALILWAHPRTRSTMTERCFIARPDILPFHEPMGDAYYWGPERISLRFSAERCAKEYKEYENETFMSVWKKITSPPAGKVCFSKEMAQCLFVPGKHVDTVPKLHEEDGNPTLIPTSELLAPGIVHAFLIRTPSKAVPSWYKKVMSPSTAGFDSFDPEELGIHETRKLYEFIASKSPSPPLLIESDDIVEHSEDVLRVLCESSGIGYDPGMLNWQASINDARKLFAKYPEIEVEKSSGIIKNLNAAAESEADLPSEVQDAIDKNMADYSWMKERAYRFS